MRRDDDGDNARYALELENVMPKEQASLRSRMRTRAHATAHASKAQFHAGERDEAEGASRRALRVVLVFLGSPARRVCPPRRRSVEREVLVFVLGSPNARPSTAPAECSSEK